MTEEQKKFILERIGKIPQHILAQQVGVHQSTISNMKRRLALKEAAKSLPHDSRRKKAGGQRKYG